MTRRRLGSTGAAAAGAVVGICGLIVETSSVFVAGFVTVLEGGGEWVKVKGSRASSMNRESRCA